MVGDRVIAIDGPAGSGKSTVAQAVARKLGVAYLDTGAMYRSVTHVALARGVDVDDGDALARLAHDLEIEVGDRVVVDGVDVSEAIRAPAVNGAVSTVSAHPGVRRELVGRQRLWAGAHEGGVMEGRDIGTVVFPDARLKVFLTAGEGERARRLVQHTGQALQPPLLAVTLLVPGHRQPELLQQLPYGGEVGDGHLQVGPGRPGQAQHVLGPVGPHAHRPRQPHLLAPHHRGA